MGLMKILWMEIPHQKDGLTSYYYKEWDVYHLSTGAGFRNHPQYHGDIMGYIYIYMHVYIYVYI